MIKTNTLSHYFRTRIKVFRNTTSDFVSAVGRKQSQDQNLLTGHLHGPLFPQGIRTKLFFPKRALQQPWAWPTDVLEQQCPASVSPDGEAAACRLLCSLLRCAHSSAERVVLQGGCPNPTGLTILSSWTTAGLQTALCGLLLQWRCVSAKHGEDLITFQLFSGWGNVFFHLKSVKTVLVAAYLFSLFFLA